MRLAIDSCFLLCKMDAILAFELAYVFDSLSCFDVICTTDINDDAHSFW
ncbi:Uncharacterized protein BN1183_AX_00890 [Pantoea ananatis]|nr:hypothetical protein PANA5342_2275 [Pantoea ananatis LMG 5342]CRH33842.1 Uncharacterized protein BN1183_AX_00890 [Pantoea ananatis]